MSQGQEAGSCTIPARKLYDYIKLLPGGDISINCSTTTGCRFAAAASNTKWWHWRAQTTPGARFSGGGRDQHLTIALKR